VSGFTQTVVLTLTAAGSVSDYEDTSSLQQNVAIAAGVGTSRVTIEVSAASVIITATIAVPPSTTAAAVQASLSSNLGIAAVPSTAPSTALGVTVLTVPTITIVLPLRPPPTPPLPSRPSFAPPAANSTLPAADVVTSEVMIGATAGGICAIVVLCGTAYFCFIRRRGVSRIIARHGHKSTEREHHKPMATQKCAFTAAPYGPPNGAAQAHQRLRLFTVGSFEPAAALPRLSVRGKRKPTPPLRAPTAHDSQHGEDPLHGVSQQRVQQRLRLFTVGSSAPAAALPRLGVRGKRKPTPPLTTHDSQHGDNPDKRAAHDNTPTRPSNLHHCTPAQIADPDTTKPAARWWDDDDDDEWEPPHVLQVEIRNDSAGDGYHVYNV
jgi:hypothetical protein